MAHKDINRVGEVYGRWTILAFQWMQNQNRNVYICRCSECGTLSRFANIGQVQYVGTRCPTCQPKSKDRKKPGTIGDFRLWAFYVAYNNMYATVENTTVRFGLAMAYSALSEVNDSEKFNAWCKNRNEAILQMQLQADANAVARRQEDDELVAAVVYE